MTPRVIWSNEGSSVSSFFLSLEETPASSRSYCGWLPTKYPELLRAIFKWPQKVHKVQNGEFEMAAKDVPKWYFARYIFSATPGQINTINRTVN